MRLRVRPVTLRFTEPGQEDWSTDLHSLRQDETLFDAEPLPKRETTVRQLKAQIVAVRPALEGKRLRLIHAGQLLRDGTQLVEWLDTLDSHRGLDDSVESQQTVALSELLQDHGGKAPDKQVQLTRSQARTIYIQCSVGEDHQEAEPAPVLQQERGFDRLRSAGLSEHEIEQMRSTFHSSLPRSGDLLREQEEQDHARALEEQWVDSLSTPAETNAQSGLFQTILEGLMLGFFLPLIPLFFLRGDAPHPSGYPNIPAEDDEEEEEQAYSRETIFSKNMQVALVFGLATNLIMGAFTLIW